MRSNRLLSINYNKTAYIKLTATRSQNCNFEISMNGVRIQQTDSIKYFGVIIGNKPSWKPQISSFCGKAASAMKCEMCFPLECHQSAKVHTAVVWEACERKSQSSTCARSFHIMLYLL